MLVRVSTAVILTQLLISNGCSGEKKSILTRSASIVTVKAANKRWACGSLTSQIMPLESPEKGATLDKIEYGFEFWLADGIEDPESFQAEGVYELKGYYYYTKEKGAKHLAPRFDLIGWRIIAPYTDLTKGFDAGVEEKPFDKYWRQEESKKQVFVLSRKYDNGCGFL